MYKDNELYEINIDKLIRSFESNEQLSVEDYIDDYSMEASMRKDEFDKKKPEIMKALNNMYDKCTTMVDNMANSFAQKAVSRGAAFEKPEKVAQVIKSNITMVQKAKFTNEMMESIESDAHPVPVFVLKTGPIKSYIGDNKLLDFLRLWMTSPLPFLNALSPLGAVLYWGTGSVATNITNVNKMAKQSSKSNRYFKASWDGITKKAWGAKWGNGITDPELTFVIKPKFKIKIN